MPYMRFASSDRKLQALLRGLVRRQTRQILHDPFANAFNVDEVHGDGAHRSDNTAKPSFLGTTTKCV